MSHHNADIDPAVLTSEAAKMTDEERPYNWETCIRHGDGKPLAVPSVDRR